MLGQVPGRVQTSHGRFRFEDGIFGGLVLFACRGCAGEVSEVAVGTLRLLARLYV